MRPRSLPILLAVALAASGGCAPDAGGGFGAPPRDAAGQARVTGLFTARLDEADDAVEAAVARLDAYERRTRREAAAVAYATGRSPAPPRRAAPAELSAAAAAGRVLGPGFDALALHARHLGALAAGTAPRASPGTPDAAALTREATAGLASLRAATGGRVTAPQSGAGIAAIATLAAPPPAGADLRTVVMQRQGEVEALTALLRSVVGERPDSGLRAALAAREAEAARAHAALVAAARRERGLGVMGRYEFFHQSAEAEIDDPEADAALLEVLRVLERLPPAHAALAEAEGAAALARIEALGAAVDRLWQAQRQEPPGG